MCRAIASRFLLIEHLLVGPQTPSLFASKHRHPLTRVGKRQKIALAASQKNSCTRIRSARSWWLHIACYNTVFSPFITSRFDTSPFEGFAIGLHHHHVASA